MAEAIIAMAYQAVHPRQRAQRLEDSVVTATCPTDVEIRDVEERFDCHLAILLPGMSVPY